MLVGSRTITVDNSWQPSSEAILGSDPFAIPGFGLRADGTGYYDPLGSDSVGTSPAQTAEAAQVGLALPCARKTVWTWISQASLPSLSLTRVLPPSTTQASPRFSGHWAHATPPRFLGPSPPRPGYWTHAEPAPFASSSPKPGYWTHAQPARLEGGSPEKPRYWIHEHPSVVLGGSSPKPLYWTHEQPPAGIAGSPLKPAYWTHEHPARLEGGSSPKPLYWTHEHPPEAPLVPTQPVTRFV